MARPFLKYNGCNWLSKVVLYRVMSLARRQFRQELAKLLASSNPPNVKEHIVKRLHRSWIQYFEREFSGDASSARTDFVEKVP